MRIAVLLAFPFLAAPWGAQTQLPQDAWGPTQVIGAPDVPYPADHPLAWASLRPDAGTEWIEVVFGDAARIKKLRIHESYNPGAIVRVTGIGLMTRREKTLWEQFTPTADASRVLEVEPRPSMKTDRVRIYLDTSRVPGWNEIDAVEMVADDGSRQWAMGARASSTYARTRPAHPSAVGPAGRPWGPEQVIGAPQVESGNDDPRAWASLKPDNGREWLVVSFEETKVIKEVRIRESFNPGAVFRVTAIDENGVGHVLWEGDDPTRKAPSDFLVRPTIQVEARTVRIELDTHRVPGWNEIDGVAMVGTDGSIQWAAKAKASSTYAEPADHAPEGVEL